MSTLKIDNILDLSGSETTPPSIPGLQPQLAKAWVNFAGQGSPVINEGFNVSGVTRGSTGSYTITYTSPVDGSYSVSVTNTSAQGQVNEGSVLPNSVSITTRSSNGTATNASEAFIIVFGN